MHKGKKRPYIRLVAAAICAATVMVSDAQAAFADVPSNAYYKSAVDWAVSEGITSGKDSSHFAPSGVCTRAQTVTFLWRAVGSPARRSLCPYTDVKSTDYYYDAVCWASLHGITSGVSATEFAPNKPVTRAQVASFLHRVAARPSAKDGGNFSDVNSSAYYAEAVRWAASKGITTGTSTTTFSPNKGCTRAEIVTFLYRSKNISDDTTTTPVEPATPVPPTQDETKIEIPAKQPTNEIKREDLDTSGPNTVDEGDSVGAYYAMLEGLKQLEDEVDISKYRLWTTDALVAASSAYADATHINCLSETDSTRINAIVNENTHRVSAVRFDYGFQNSTLEQMRQENKAFWKKIKEIVAQETNAQMSDYEKAKALHDYLVLNNEYDMRLYSGTLPGTSYSAYGALMKQTSVCAGYAWAYQLLLEEAGVPSEYVTGETTRGAHGWNVIQIDGEWYHVDTTWDDPIPDQKGRVRYDYFLRSDSYMKSHDHTSWKSSHSCTDTSYDSTKLPSTSDQNKADSEQEWEQEREQMIQNIQDEIKKQLDARPYQNAESLTNAANLSYDDVHFYVYLPDEYDIHQRVYEAYRTFDMSPYEPDMKTNGIESPNVTEDKRWHLEFWRNDVWDEMQRRDALQRANEQEEQKRQEEENKKQQEEAEKKQLEEIEKKQRDAAIAKVISRVTSIVPTERNSMYRIEFDSSYSEKILQEACTAMMQKDYRMGSYTAGDDYELQVSNGGIYVLNYRWSCEVKNECIASLEEAIRVHTPTTVLERGYNGSAWQQIAMEAYETVNKPGYSFDGYTAGADYNLSLSSQGLSNIYFQIDYH